VLCRLLVIQKIKSAACNSEESVGWWFKWKTLSNQRRP
jgi:hypothetical protein